MIYYVPFAGVAGSMQLLRFPQKAGHAPCSVLLYVGFTYLQVLLLCEAYIL